MIGAVTGDAGLVTAKKEGIALLAAAIAARNLAQGEKDLRDRAGALRLSIGAGMRLPLRLLVF